MNVFDDVFSEDEVPQGNIPKPAKAKSRNVFDDVFEEDEKPQSMLARAGKTAKYLAGEGSSLAKDSAMNFANKLTTTVPKAFWSGASILKDVADEHPAFTPWAAATQFIPKDLPEKQLAEVEKTEEYLTPEERTGWTRHVVDAAGTLGGMAGSGGNLGIMAGAAGIDKAYETRKEGYSLPKSLVAGGMTAGTEYITEKTALKYLTQIGLPYLKRLAGGFLSDIPGETAAQFIEMKSVDEGLLGKEYTPQEFAQALLGAAANSAITTGVATTAMQPFRGAKPPVLEPEQPTDELPEVKRVPGVARKLLKQSTPVGEEPIYERQSTPVGEEPVDNKPGNVFDKVFAEEIPTKQKSIIVTPPMPSGDAHPEIPVDKFEKVRQSIIKKEFDPSISLSQYRQFGKLNGVTIKATDQEGAFTKLRRDIIDNPKGYDIIAKITPKSDAEYMATRMVKQPSGDAHPETASQIMPEPAPPTPLSAEDVATEQPEPEEFLVDMPELVEVVDMLDKGNYPQVKKALGNALGRFRGKGESKNISLRADLAQNDRLSRKVLSHELLHWIDYIPQNTLKRGNILGHVSSMVKYFKHAVDKVPTENTQVITNEVRSELKRQAMSNIRGQKPANIWAAAKAEYDRLLAEKKAEASKFLVTKKEVAEELKNVVREFNREFYKTPEELERGIQYYFSKPKELYADAGAAFVLRPKLFAQHAPKTFHFSTRYLGKKPQAQAVFREFRDRIKNWSSEQVEQNRLERGYEMTAKGEEAYSKPLREAENVPLLQKAKDVKTRGKQELVDIYSPIYDGIKNLKVKKHVKAALETFAYRFSPIEAYYNKVLEKSFKPLRASGVEEKHVAEYLKAERNINERTEVFNPGGHNAESGERTLNALRRELGDGKFGVLEKSVGAFRNARKAHVIDFIKKHRMHDPELVKQIEDNIYYATYDNVKYIEARYGKEIAAHIHESTGMLGDTANPYTATLTKDAAIIKSLLQNTAKREAVQGLLTEPGNDIKKAPLKPKPIGLKNGKPVVVQAPENPTDPRYGLITYLDDGKLQGYHVPKIIAGAFDANPVASWVITRSMQRIAQPFRELFTRKNLGFMGFNNIKDPITAIMILPKADLIKFLPLYVKAYSRSWKSILSYVPEVNEMLQRGELITAADRTGMTPDDTQAERLLRHKGFEVSSKLRIDLKVVETLGSWLNFLSELGERATKIAAKDFLNKYHPDMPQEEKSRFIRWSGTPALLVKGRATPLINNIVLFSNPFIQGWRSQAEAFKENKLGYGFKTFKYAVLPKAFMMAGTLGLMGDEIKKMFEYITINDLVNYYTIPLYWANGKLVYLRIPMTETNRFVSGLIMKTFLDVYTKSKFTSNLSSLFGYFGEQFPGFNPAIKTAVDLAFIANGHVPVDDRGIPVIRDQRVVDANDMRTVEAYSKHFARQLGLGVVYNTSSDRIGDVKGELEKVLGYPVVSNIAGRFIKVTNGDYGIASKKPMEGVPEYRQQHAGRLLDLDEAARQFVTDGTPPTEAIRKAMREEENGRQYYRAKVKFYREKSVGQADPRNKARNRAEEEIIEGNMRKEGRQ